MVEQDVLIKIFGKPTDPAALLDLAIAAVAEGQLDRREDLRLEDFPNLLETAASEGRPLVLTCRDSDVWFDAVREACQAAGLSYIMLRGPRGTRMFTDGLTWRPNISWGGAQAEMATAQIPFMLHGEDAVLPVAMVEMAAQHGLDTVKKLATNIRLAAQEGPIELEPGFIETFRSHAGIESKSPSL